VSECADGRDEYIDFLRAASVVGIVFGHWFIASAWWQAGRIGVGNALTVIPELWPGTWILMAVPVIFFAGGFANHRVLTGLGASGRPIGEFYLKRGRRLLVPTVLFLGSWAGAEVILHTFALGGSHVIRGVTARGDGPFGPLWFMGVYLGLIALSPVTLALHRRYGAAIPAIAVAACAAVDALRFAAHLPLIGWLNLVFAWVLPHQLGYFYADGSVSTGPRRAPILMCLTGISVLTLLTCADLYPRTIGGIPGEKISNMAPPTFIIAALALWQVGLVLMCHPQIVKLSSVPAVSAAVSRLTSVTLSVYLWHMTALLVMLLLIAPTGLSGSAASLTAWWLQRPVWLAAGIAILAAIMKLVGWAERVR
jgi:hypothetical protein